MRPAALEALSEVDRYVAIVKAKQPLLVWLKAVDASSGGLTLEGINSDPTAYLIPYDDVDEEPEAMLRQCFESIFEQELVGWWTRAEDWPQDLTWDRFEAWFEYSIISMVVDCGAAPIEQTPLF